MSLNSENMKKIIILLIVMILLPFQAYAYPNIIHEKGTNQTMNLELVYTFPERWYDGVDSITFTKDGIPLGEGLIVAKYGINWYTPRNGDTYYYNGRIWIFGKKIKNYNEHNMLEALHHELCHIQHYVKDKKNYNNETHAETCILR